MFSRIFIIHHTLGRHERQARGSRSIFEEEAVQRRLKADTWSGRVHSAARAAANGYEAAKAQPRKRGIHAPSDTERRNRSFGSPPKRTDISLRQRTARRSEETESEERQRSHNAFSSNRALRNPVRPSPRRERIESPATVPSSRKQSGSARRVPKRENDCRETSVSDKSNAEQIPAKAVETEKTTAANRRPPPGADAAPHSTAWRNVKYLAVR